jgi:hypothetical protein
MGAVRPRPTFRVRLKSPPAAPVRFGGRDEAVLIDEDMLEAFPATAFARSTALAAGARATGRDVNGGWRGPSSLTKD